MEEINFSHYISTINIFISLVFAIDGATAM